MMVLDAPVRVGGSSAYRDHLDPRRFHVLPAPPILSDVERRGQHWRLTIQAHPLPQHAGPEQRGRPLQLETVRCHLVRFEARRRKDDPSAQFLVLRSLLQASAADEPPGMAALEGELSLTDSEGLEEALSAAGPFLLLSVVSAVGLEAPVRLALHLDPRACWARLAELHPPSALVPGPVFEEGIQRLRDEGHLGLDGQVEGPRVEAFVARAVGSTLFEPAPSPEVLAPTVRAPLGAAAADFGVVARSFRDREQLPEGALRIDGRKGWVRRERFALAAPVDGLASRVREAASRPFVQVLGPADWSGVERIEVEARGTEGGTARFELSERAPARELPSHDLPALRARAVLAPGEVVLERPEWTPWLSAAFSRTLLPQKVAGRIKVGAALGWVDPTQVVSAQVELRGPDGGCVMALDAGDPERHLSVVGRPRWVTSEVELAASPPHVEHRDLDTERSVAVGSLPEGPGPVLVRLVDPTRRHVQVEVEIASDGVSSRRFRLSPAAPEAVWDPGVPSPDGVYRWRSWARLEEGRTVSLDWRPGQVALLEVGDPQVELRTLELSASREWAPEGAWLLVEAVDPPVEVSSRVEVFLEAGVSAVIEVPFRVGSPLEYLILGERYGVPEADRNLPSKVVRSRRWSLG